MLSLNILFPVLNEELRLQNGIETTYRYMEEHFRKPYQLTIIDNGSTDSTPKLARELEKKYPSVRYIRTPQRGVGIAFREGIKINEADIIGYMDIDLSTDIKHISDMYRVFDSQPDIQIVNASRLNRKSVTLGRKWYRNITSHGLAFLIRSVFRINATDVICGFKFFRKETLEKLTARTRPDNGWFYIIELLIRAEKAHIPIYELPVRWTDDYNTTVHVGKLIAYYIKNIYRLKIELGRNGRGK